jgi:hypothetical protein
VWALEVFKGAITKITPLRNVTQDIITRTLPLLSVILLIRSERRYHISIYFYNLKIEVQRFCETSIRVVTLSKTWTVFTSSFTGVVISNATQGMDVCLRLFCVRVLLLVDSLVTGWSPIQGVLPIVNRITKIKKKIPTAQQWTVEPLINEWGIQPRCENL